MIMNKMKKNIGSRWMIGRSYDRDEYDMKIDGMRALIIFVELLMNIIQKNRNKT